MRALRVDMHVGANGFEHLEARGCTPPFRRMVWRPIKPVPVGGFLLRMPDGTCARVIADEVVSVWCVGARPDFVAQLPKNNI